MQGQGGLPQSLHHEELRKWTANEEELNAFLRKFPFIASDDEHHPTATKMQDWLHNSAGSSKTEQSALWKHKDQKTQTHSKKINPNISCFYQSHYPAIHKTIQHF